MAINDLDNLTQDDLSLIHDECTRFEEAHERIAKEVNIKVAQLGDDQKLARALTSQVVATQRDEEKQALQSDENVAHGLARLRLTQSNALSDLAQQPYFARVIYNEKGRDVEFRLGLASFPELRIIDWRKAPISKLYYDYEEGDAYDDEIAGVERQGKIKLKRAYRGKSNVLASIDLKEVSYVQSRGAWHKQSRGQKTLFSMKDKDKIRELLKTQDTEQFQEVEEQSGYLKQVLSLLTPEQFRMISMQADRPVIIQGSAGTGKTTIALHRLAWLLFEGNSPFKPENVLVIIFNKSLASYVKHVLPELGIHNVKIATFFDWADEIIFTMLGKKLPLSEGAPLSSVARFKSRHETLETFKTYLAKTPDPKDEKALLEFYHSEELLHLLRQQDAHHEVEKALYQQSQTGLFDSYDKAFVLHALFASHNTYRSKMYPIDLEYLIVDEAQDFNVAELQAVLNALEDKRMLTLAGDLGQKVLENRDFGSWQQLLGELSLSDADVLSLNIAYRSTYQIYELAEFVRDPNLNEDDLQLTPKFGPEPVLTLCSSFKDAVFETKKWLEDIARFNRYAIGAVICRTRPEARAVYDALVKLGTHGIRLGDDKNFEFTPGITITDVGEIKGLEFANVLLFDPSVEKYVPAHSHDRNALYVAITRAEYRVDMICYGTPSPILPDFISVNDLTRINEQVDEKPLFSDIDQDTEKFVEDEDLTSDSGESENPEPLPDDEED